MRRMDYMVQRNKPYAGGYITEHYGVPASGYHAIQIEINRALYMDERRLLRTERFAAVADDLTTIAQALSDAIGLNGLKAAAE
jgi:N-formylglutamate amidohydrolase